MTKRVLKRREYSRLKGTELEEVYAGLSKDSKVIVVEDEGEIVGTWALIPYYHVECFWISEKHRKLGGVAKGLFQFMFGLLRSMGVKSVWTASVDEKVDKFIIRLGAVKLPGNHFALPIGE